MSQLKEIVKVLIQERKEKDVKGQSQVEGRQLAKLLGDKKAAAPLLKILKTTGIERKEVAREKQLEWEQKSNQTSKNLPG